MAISRINCITNDPAVFPLLVYQVPTYCPHLVLFAVNAAFPFSAMVNSHAGILPLAQIDIHPKNQIDFADSLTRDPTVQ